MANHYPGQPISFKEEPVSISLKGSVKEITEFKYKVTSLEKPQQETPGMDSNNLVLKTQYIFDEEKILRIKKRNGV